tara:strand:+ start:90 stop:422 length:333 start_codon:yes stop_codon:yes gene_type:complete
MWDWSHFKELGWIAHTTRAARLSGLLILAGLAMVLHMLLPFWQQPSWLRVESVGRELCGCKDCPPEVEPEALEITAAVTDADEVVEESSDEKPTPPKARVPKRLRRKLKK